MFISILIFALLVTDTFQYVRMHFIILNVYKSTCSSEPAGYKVENLTCPFTTLRDVTMTEEPDAPIVITFANEAWVNITKNWICQAQKAGVNKTLVVAFSKNLCNKISPSPNHYCWYPNITIDRNSVSTSVKLNNEGTWGTIIYQNLMKFRTPIIYSLLNCKRNILLADSDVVFLRNPLEYLTKKASRVSVGKSYDVMFMKDSTGLSPIDWLGQRGWLGNFYVNAGKYI